MIVGYMVVYKVYKLYSRKPQKEPIRKPTERLLLEVWSWNLRWPQSRKRNY
jgi:hypothetical protein